MRGIRTYAEQNRNRRGLKSARYELLFIIIPVIRWKYYLDHTSTRRPPSHDWGCIVLGAVPTQSPCPQKIRSLMLDAVVGAGPTQSPPLSMATLQPQFPPQMNSRTPGGFKDRSPSWGLDTVPSALPGSNSTSSGQQGSPQPWEELQVPA